MVNCSSDIILHNVFCYLSWDFVINLQYALLFPGVPGYVISILLNLCSPSLAPKIDDDGIDCKSEHLALEYFLVMP